MRLGSVTHAFDMEQRLVGLCGPSPQPACAAANNTLNLTTPPNGNIAPPGYYMLFLLDSAGVPSKAQILKLTPYITTPPKGVISTPTDDVTIQAGGTVNFSTSTVATQYSWVFPGGSPATSTAQNPGTVTYSTPGSYTASLTVIDGSGNSDPSPPSVDVYVQPTTPDFEVSVASDFAIVQPGGTAKYAVTVTPLNGFTGSVQMSRPGTLPTGITSQGFWPNPVTINGTNPVSTTLTINTTTSAVPQATYMPITGVSGSLKHIAASNLLVNAAPPANFTATPGDGKVTLSWSPAIGATGGYMLKRGVPGPYYKIACSTATNATDSGLTNGKTYQYSVATLFTGDPTVNGGGNTEISKIVSSTPTAALPPAAPTGLSANAGGTAGNIALQWTQSTTSGVTQNGIYRRLSTDSAFPTTPTTTISAATAYQDGGLTSGAMYCYVVTAIGPTGVSAQSNSSCATAP
jgi:hypothetical protein